MLLQDNEIKKRIQSLFPDHWDQLTQENRVQPASVDLTVVGPLMRVSAPATSDSPIRPGNTELREVSQVRPGVWVLRPGTLYLISTREKVSIPHDMVGRLDGRSSWGRCGLRVHSTAGFIDPGFVGLITLELDVVSEPVELRLGDSICQISFQSLLGSAQNPYGSGAGSKYQNQMGVTESRSLELGKSK